MTMNLWKKIGRAVRHRLVLQKLTQRVLVKLGIRIEAYYWTQEGLAKAAPPGWERNLEDYRFSAFGPEEMQTIALLVPWRPAAMTQAWLDEGRRCFGIKHHGQIAAYVWCNLTECMYPWHQIPLADNEVYLFDQFTLDAFRGRNIAPYLRHRTYGALREMGRDTFYSVTHRFNRSAVRFKRKLGARFLHLGLGVKLFGKVRHHCILRRYRT
jgi:hypothetical protein